MIKSFPKVNLYDKEFAEVLKEAQEENGIVLGAFQIVRFEQGKWYAVEDTNGERRILKRDYQLFIERDGKWAGNITIAKVYWEFTEEELFSETFSPYPVDRT